MVTKSLSGTKNLLGAISVLAFSPEPLSLYAVAKSLGISNGTAKRILDALQDAGHITRLNNGKYTVTPDYVYVYDGVAIYKHSDKEYLMIMPDYDDLTDDEIYQKFIEIRHQLPASVRLWINMEPRKFSQAYQQQ